MEMLRAIPYPLPVQTLQWLPRKLESRWAKLFKVRVESMHATAGAHTPEAELVWRRARLLAALIARNPTKDDSDDPEQWQCIRGVMQEVGQNLHAAETGQWIPLITQLQQYIQDKTAAAQPGSQSDASGSNSTRVHERVAGKVNSGALRAARLMADGESLAPPSTQTAQAIAEQFPDNSNPLAPPPRIWPNGPRCHCPKSRPSGNASMQTRRGQPQEGHSFGIPTSSQCSRYLEALRHSPHGCTNGYSMGWCLASHSSGWKLSWSQSVSPTGVFDP